jgi:hypothetical protein
MLLSADSRWVTSSLIHTSKVDNHIRSAGHGAGGISRHVEVGRQGIEDLPRVREVGLESIHIRRGIWEWDEVQV